MLAEQVSRLLDYFVTFHHLQALMSQHEYLGKFL